MPIHLLELASGENKIVAAFRLLLFFFTDMPILNTRWCLNTNLRWPYPHVLKGSSVDLYHFWPLLNLVRNSLGKILFCESLSPPPAILQCNCQIFHEVQSVKCNVPVCLTPVCWPVDSLLVGKLAVGKCLGIYSISLKT
jgi:hypothetical protein